MGFERVPPLEGSVSTGRLSGSEALRDGLTFMDQR